MKFRIAIVFVLTSCAGSSPDPYLWLEQTTRPQFTFTRPGREVSLPQKRKPLEMILRNIDSAEEQIDLFVYGFDHPEIIKKLKAARERNVQIRVYGSADEDYDDEILKNFQVYIRAKTGLQHAKLILIDEQRLVAGSGNFTVSGLHYNNNFFFEQSVSSTQATAVRQALLEDESAPPVTDTGLMFAAGPVHGRLIQSVLVQAILSARGKIRVMIYSFTDPVIASALAVAASKGVVVEIITDEQWGPLKNSVANELNSQSAMLPLIVYEDGNRNRFGDPPFYSGSKLHHKVLITDDSTVYGGSYNYSINARDSNTETFFAWKDMAIADLFIEEFERLKSTAKPAARSPSLTGEYQYRRQTVFSSPGPFFFAEHSVSETHSAASAGLALYESYENALPAEIRTEGIAAGIVFYPPAEVPCKKGCKAAGITSGSAADGWLWLKSPDIGRLKSLRFYGRHGLSKVIAPARITKAFYEFNPPGESYTDSIVLLENTAGNTYAGCIVSGSTDSAIRLWIHTNQWITGHSVQCGKHYH